MKINIQKFVRVVAPFVFVFVVLFLCVLPASAAVLNYNDYITNISVSGDDDHITLKFPGFGMWNLQETLSYNSLNKYTNSSLEFPRYYPLMDSSGTSNAFLRSDFPDDTSFAFSFKANTQNSPSAGYLNVRQFDSSGAYIGLITVDLTLNVSPVDSVWNVLTTFYMNSIDFNPSCHTFYFDFEFYTEGIPSQLGGTDTVYWYYFEDPSFILNLTINSLLRQQQLSNKQNAILNAVENQLADQGKTLDDILGAQQDANNKLDDIINGSSDQQNAADKFKDDVSGSVEDLDMFGNVMNNIPYPTIDAGSLVPEDIFYGSSYLTYTSAIQEFWNSKTLSTVTWVLGSLILISYILFGEKG